MVITLCLILTIGTIAIWIIHIITITTAQVTLRTVLLTETARIVTRAIATTTITVLVAMARRWVAVTRLRDAQLLIARLTMAEYMVTMAAAHEALIHRQR